MVVTTVAEKGGKQSDKFEEAATTAEARGTVTGCV